MMGQRIPREFAFGEGLSAFERAILTRYTDGRLMIASRVFICTILAERLNSLNRAKRRLAFGNHGESVSRLARYNV